VACQRFEVSGRVQGVFFRASTRDFARSIGLRGWARNLPGGEVEVVACGTGDDLQRLRSWLWDGPPLARVKDVRVEELPEPDMPGDFEIR